MKRRNIKLLASITSFMLVMAVTAIGVFAAIQHTVGVSTQVSFTATGVTGTLAASVTGYAVGGSSKVSETDITDTTIYLAPSATDILYSSLTYSSSSAPSPIMDFSVDKAISISDWLTQANFAFGTTAGDPNYITFTFTIANTASDGGTSLKATLTNSGTASSLTFDYTDGVTVTTPTVLGLSNNYVTAAVEPGASITLTIRVVPTNKTVSLSEAAVQFALVINEISV